MRKIIKSTVMIVFGVALVLQLGGCVVAERSHRRHFNNSEKFEHNREPGIDIRIHN